MIALDLLVTWLNAVPADLDFLFVSGPRKPEFGRADEIGVVTPLEGPGLTLEGAGSVASFQIEIIGREHKLALIQKTAFQIDSALLFGDTSGVDLWGTFVQYVSRTGGEPTLGQEDEFDRVSYTCSYIAHETPER